MKKARINIAPAMGSTKEIYVDIRYDKENYDRYDAEGLVECYHDNCRRIQEQITAQNPAAPGRWRANRTILDRIYEHYSVGKN